MNTSRQTKAKSLSLSRKTQPTPPEAEDPASAPITETDKARVTRLEAALSSPIARPYRRCSTPARSNGEAAEDSPDQDAGGSPISMFPCTQDSVGEVAWDWNCAGDAPSRNGLLNATPKRRRRTKNKRLAKGNSPLLNFPQKRKIVRPDNAERISKFAEEFQALADKIKSEQETEAEKKRPDQFPLDISDMRTQLVRKSEPDIREAETPKGNREETEASLEDLFDDDDDSIDACMVRCSQEIEDKLRLESAETSADGTGEEDRTTGGKRESGGRKNESESEQEIPASQIPDDSLDDCLALCLDDDHDLVSKFLEPKRRKDEAASCSDGGRKPSPMKQPAETSPRFKRKQQCMSSDGLPVAQSRKFFKLKSLSDSLCANTSSEKARRSILNPNGSSKPGVGGGDSSPMSKSSSNTNLSSSSRTNDVYPAYKLGNSVPFAGVRNESRNVQVSHSYLRTDINGDVQRVRKFAGTSDPYEIPLNAAKKSAMDNGGSRSQLCCTPAEIERKRAEARMRLEANRLKKQITVDKSKAEMNPSAAKRPAVKR